jgi:hypothetical protein
MDVINSPQYSPLDGLPISFVRSNISAVYDDSIVLDVPAGIGLRTEPGQVPIRITPETEVFARDSYTRGDTTQLLVGDEAAVWTYTDPTSAARGAYFLYANMLQGGLVVSQVNDKNIVGSVLWRFGVPDTTVSVTLAVVDSTTITLRGDGGIAASNEEALAQIPVGSWLGFISVAVDASCDRESLTAISVFPYPWVPVTS